MTSQNTPGVDGDMIIGQHWPYDGPHTPERVAGAADALAKLIRYLNNATRSAGAIPDGPSLSDVLGSVDVAVSRLPQLLQQLGGTAERISDDPTLTDDHGEDAVQVARDATAWCQKAAARVHDAALDLRAAHQCSSRLGHRVPADGAR